MQRKIQTLRGNEAHSPGKRQNVGRGFFPAAESGAEALAGCRYDQFRNRSWVGKNGCQGYREPTKKKMRRCFVSGQKRIPSAAALALTLLRRSKPALSKERRRVCGSRVGFTRPAARLKSRLTPCCETSDPHSGGLVRTGEACCPSGEPVRYGASATIRRRKSLRSHSQYPAPSDNS